MSILLIGSGSISSKRSQFKWINLKRALRRFSFSRKVCYRFGRFGKALNVTSAGGVCVCVSVRESEQARLIAPKVALEDVLSTTSEFAVGRVDVW